MKAASSELAAHLAQEVTTLASCWKVTRRDGEVLGFTDHDSDLLVAGISYAAASGFTPSAIDSSARLNVDNMELQGLLSADYIREADILAGKYDYAKVEVFWVNYQDVSQGILRQRIGWIGEVRVQGQQFVAELRGFSQALAGQVGSHYTPVCRANFADARCKLSAASYTVSGAVSSASSAARHQFTDTSRSEDANHFAFGNVTFTSGSNAGLSMEVKAFADGCFTLVLPMPFVIEIGDAYTAIAGCDKRFETCSGRFDNALNFRGEPHVAGTDKLLETASTRS